MENQPGLPFSLEDIQTVRDRLARVKAKVKLEEGLRRNDVGWDVKALLVWREIYLNATNLYVTRPEESAELEVHVVWAMRMAGLVVSQEILPHGASNSKSH